jgi:hypothetical protein
MADVAKTFKDQLQRIKKNIQRDHEHNKANNDRFHKFKTFSNKTTISQDEADRLEALQKPVIEFNMSNAPVSRLYGEFYKQEPGIYVKSAPGKKHHPYLCEFLEGRIRYVLAKAKQEDTQGTLYLDALEGGFSRGEVYIDYSHEMSFEREIIFERVYEPTMAGEDPAARKKTKKDADWYYKLYPMSLEEFKTKYPKCDTSKLKFMRNGSGGFDWSFSVGEEKMVVLAEYYEKKRKRVKIVELSNKHVMTLEDYNKSVAAWELAGYMEQHPVAINERWTTTSHFERYRLIETEVLEHDKTHYKEPNMVFFDGSSAYLKDGGDTSNSIVRFTRPYIYLIQDIQRLVNLAGQTLAAELENMTMHKVIIAEEALPTQDEFMDAYTDVQTPSNYVYNAIDDDNPDRTLPPPTAVQRTPTPPEVTNTFNNGMAMFQNILGTYDAELGINNKDLSGVAIVEGATQSNAAAMPYVINHMQGLTQIGRLIVQMHPHHFINPTMVPILTKEGKTEHVSINTPGGLSMHFDPESIDIIIEAGVSYAIAKNRAFDQMIALMKVMPKFNAFMDEEGTEQLLDNMEFEGIDLLKKKFEKWQKEQAQKPPQPTPDQIDAQTKMMNAQTNQQKLQLQQAEMQEKKQQNHIESIMRAIELEENAKKNATERLQVMVNAGESAAEIHNTLVKSTAEENRTRAEMAIDIGHLALEKQRLDHDQLADALRLQKELKEKPESKGEGD